MSGLVEISRSFRAMNTDVTSIIADVPENRLAAARALSRMELLFRLIESVLSRFMPNSELGKLNGTAGSDFRASGMLIQAVDAALEAARMTDGLFDPTLLPNMISAGYDRSFEQINRQSANLSAIPENRGSGWRNIIINHAEKTIRLPPGSGLDLGGIGKGWAVDQACRILKSFSNFALDAGGDIRVQGRQIDSNDWCVGVDDPLHTGQNLTTLHLSEGAICTSTTVKRKWQASGLTLHHLIDPRTGQPSLSGVISSTVIAETAARAEVLAKAALIAGPIRGIQLLEKQPHCRGLLVLDDGAVLTAAMEVPQGVA
jgi:thiamine biosynthesis lipoprotein